jgi:hypothetical protein
VIKLTDGHIIPSADRLARRKYCKWHDSYSHTINECNYFQRKVQSVINDGWLALGNEDKMKLDVDPFPMNMVSLEGKRVLVRTDHAKSMKGKNVMVSDELRHHMMKPPTLGSIGHVVGVRSDDAKAVDDGCMLGGVVSCKLASEVHVNGLRVSTIR